MDAMFRRMEQWADGVAYFNAPARPGAGYNGVKTPARRDLVNSPDAGVAVQQRYVGLVLKAAARMRAIKPSHLAESRVVAFVKWPELSDSGVDVFFDQAYWHGFTQRDSRDASWVPLCGEDSLATRLGVVVPDGFREHGYRFHHRDDTFDPPSVDEGEYWFFSEVLDGEALP